MCKCLSVPRHLCYELYMLCMLANEHIVNYSSGVHSFSLCKVLFCELMKWLQFKFLFSHTYKYIYMIIAAQIKISQSLFGVTDVSFGRSCIYDIRPQRDKQVCQAHNN